MASKRKFVVPIVIGVLLIGILAIAQIVQASPSGQPENIFGSWSSACTATTVPGGFPALLTFISDGSVLTDEPAPPGETTGHGNWVRGRHGEVGFTFVGFMADPTGMGVYAGKLKVAGTLQRDARTNTWSGPFRITIFDANNQVILVDTGTFKLTRIEVEPLN